jgi:hypothetical protein
MKVESRPSGQFRRPFGYLGPDHETRGSDILAVLSALKMPEQVLGAETFAKVKELDPVGWYPASMLIELTERIEVKVGHFALMQVGRKAFVNSQEAYVRGQLHSARDVVYGIDDWYHRVNRGTDIGGWTVVSFAPGRAELKKTTPHHCAMVEGIFLEALSSIGIPALIEQPTCLRNKGPFCIYVITSALMDERWTGETSA